MNITISSLTVTNDQIKNIRILSDHEIVIGDKVLSYDFKDELLYDLQTNMSRRSTSDTDQEIILLEPFAKVRKVTPSEMHQTKSVIDAYHEAEEYFFRIGAPFAGSPIKIVNDKEPLFLMEVYGLQDAAVYVIRNCGLRLPIKDRFDYFLGELGYWWIADFIGVPKAVELARNFYTRYYPIIEGKIATGKNTNV